MNHFFSSVTLEMTFEVTSRKSVTFFFNKKYGITYTPEQNLRVCHICVIKIGFSFKIIENSDGMCVSRKKFKEI